MASGSTQEPVASFKPDKFFFSLRLRTFDGIVLDDSPQFVPKSLVACDGIMSSELAKLERGVCFLDTSEGIEYFRT